MVGRGSNGRWAMAEHSRCSDESKREKKPGRMALLDQKTLAMKAVDEAKKLWCWGLELVLWLMSTNETKVAVFEGSKARSFIMG